MPFTTRACIKHLVKRRSCWKFNLITHPWEWDWSIIWWRSGSVTPQTCLVLLATQHMVPMRCFLWLPGRDHSVGLVLHKEVHVLTRHKTAVRPAGKTWSPSQSRGEETSLCVMAVWLQQCSQALHLVGKETPRRLQGSEGSGSADCEGHIQMWKQLQQRSKSPPITPE